MSTVTLNTSEGTEYRVAHAEPSAVVRVKSGDLVVIAAWFGLITGLAEVLVLAFKKFVLHQFINAGPTVVWMAPLADAILFTMVGLSLLLVARFRRKLLPLGVIIFVFAFFQCLSLLLMYPRLHYFANFLLAAGVAVQATRFTVTRSEAFLRLVRHSTGWVLAGLVAVAVSLHAWQIISERRAVASLPAAPIGSPNVLLIVLDTVRAQSMSLYGYSRPTTPELERLARKGILFEHAISTAPWTLPSHASMFTGRSFHELSVDWMTPLDATYPTLAEVLSSRGYMTAGFVANKVYCGYQTGLSRGFIHYEDHLISLGDFILSSALAENIANSRVLRRMIGHYDILGRKTAAQINNNFLRWLLPHRDRPFYAFLNYYDAHEPYLPPRPFDAQFMSETSRNNSLIRHWGHEADRLEKERMSPQEIQRELDAYESSIAYLDHHLGLLFDELDKAKVLDNTFVIVTADHGEAFGERGLFGHGNSLYMSQLQVPLILSFPARLPKNISIGQPVSPRNIPATVFEVLNLEVNDFPGASFAKYWEGLDRSSGLAPDVLSELLHGDGEIPASQWKGAVSSLIAEGKHYIYNADGSEELYDFKSDRWEKRNLASSPESSEAITRFRLLLAQLLPVNQGKSFSTALSP